MLIYHIKDWSNDFETDETRKRKTLAWVPVPNKQDGLGFKRMAAQRERCELMAAWILMLQIASKGAQPERGILMRDGLPLDAEALSLMTGFPLEVFERAFTFFSNPKQGWLVSVEVPDTTANSARPAPECTTPVAACTQNACKPEDSDIPPADSPEAPARSAATPARHAVTPAPSAIEEKRRERKEEKDISAAASLEALADDCTPVVLTFPCVGQASQWLLRQSFVDRLRSLYPTIDTEAQCRLALAKIERGAVAKKTARGMSKFLFSWMDRSSNRAPGSEGYSRERRATFA